MVKMKNKRATKRKERLAKLHALFGSLLSSCLGSSVVLLSHCMPTLVFRLGSLAISSSPCILVSISRPGSSTVSLFHYVLTLVSCLGSPAISLSPLLPASVSCPGSPAVLSSCCLPALAASTALSLPHHALASRHGISALLLLLPVLGLSFPFGSSTLRIFKQSLSHEPWSYVSASLAKLFCPFPALGAYNPDNNNSLHKSTNSNKLKQDFDILFINSCPLAGNYDQKEVNLSFASCGCLDAVKFNRSWQLDHLDPKPVCITEDIPFAAFLF